MCMIRFIKKNVQIVLSSRKCSLKEAKIVCNLVFTYSSLLILSSGRSIPTNDEQFVLQSSLYNAAWFSTPTIAIAICICIAVNLILISK